MRPGSSPSCQTLARKVFDCVVDAAGPALHSKLDVNAGLARHLAGMLRLATRAQPCLWPT